MADKDNPQRKRHTPTRGRKDRCKGDCPQSDICEELLEKIKKRTAEEGSNSLPKRYNDQLNGRQGPPDELMRNDGRCADMFGSGEAGKAAMRTYIAEKGLTQNSYNRWAGTLLTPNRDDPLLGWCTHEERFNQEKDKLNQHLKDYDDNDCDDKKLPKDARKWASMPAPKPSEWKDRKRQKGLDFFGGVADFIPAGRAAKWGGKLIGKGYKWIMGPGGKAVPATP